MGTSDERKGRLHKLIELALTYRSTTRTKLAELLQRDKSRLYPDTDNPRLDLLLGLAEVLDWPIEAVVDYLRYGPGQSRPIRSRDDYARLDQQLRAAYQKGNYPKMVELAQRMFVAARCQSRRRRQQVMPDPQPISCGRYSHGMPVLRTKRIPVSAARSATIGRPPLGRGGCLGNSGSITAHRSSLTSGLAIAMSSVTHTDLARWPDHDVNSSAVKWFC